MAACTLHNCTPGRTAAYTFYHLGGSVLVGLVRIAITIYHLAKHLFIEHKATRALENIQKKSEVFRDLASGKKIKKRFIQNPHPKGLTKEPKVRVHLGTQTRGALGDMAEWVRQELKQIGHLLQTGPKKAAIRYFLQSEQKKMHFWKAQLLRGVVELTFVGSPFYTCRDHLVNRASSIFGLAELKSRILSEKKFYKRLQNLRGFWLKYPS